MSILRNETSRPPPLPSLPHPTHSGIIPPVWEWKDIVPMASFTSSPSSQFVDASACGDTDAVIDFLSDASFPASSINYVDKDGRSSFHYACLNDDVPLLKILMADGRVDVLLTSPKG